MQKVKIIGNRLVNVVLISGAITIMIASISQKLATAIVFLSVLMITAVMISRTKIQYNKPFIAGALGTLIYNIGLSFNLGLPVHYLLIIPALQVGVIAFIVDKVIPK